MSEKKRPSPPNAAWDSLDVNVKSTLQDELDSIKARLLPMGYEFKLERVGYRVMMFRRGSTHWTQGYTNSAPNSTIRFTGPEIGALVGRHLPLDKIEEVQAFRAADGTLHASIFDAREHDRRGDRKLTLKELENYFLNQGGSYLRTPTATDIIDTDKRFLQLTPAQLVAFFIEPHHERYLKPLMARLYGFESA